MRLVLSTLISLSIFCFPAFADHCRKNFPGIQDLYIATDAYCIYGDYKKNFTLLGEHMAVRMHQKNFIKTCLGYVKELEVKNASFCYHTQILRIFPIGLDSTSENEIQLINVDFKRPSPLVK